ncbi:MAG: ARPP-1 family domain-containing protein [Chloroflexota bacterium]
MEKGTDSAVDAVLAWLAGLKAGEGGARGGMAVFPLKHGANGSADGAFAYRTLAEGLAEGWVEVWEQASATVPELLLRNLGKEAVLVLDGGEVVGGRQNRIANASFLVAPGATIAMPVSCVEEGRWHGVSATAIAAGRVSTGGTSPR